MGDIYICTRKLGKAASGVMSRTGIVNSRNTERRSAYKVGDRSSMEGAPRDMESNQVPKGYYT